jgi:tRNA 2-(methylsulfanyl)-N6-isopentenyladenosine37 hydroxylase
MVPESQHGISTMLHLKKATAPDWFDRISSDLDSVLIDHTHLEKRAASTALAMVFRYTGRPNLARRVGDVVREEMEHFLLMLDVLERRGVEFIRLDPAPYAASLASHCRRDEPHALLDKLLVAAFIEARSCERFRILSERLEDPELQTLYADLFESEARHHTLYTGLARDYFPETVVTERLEELAELELLALAKGTDQIRLHCA